MSARSAAWAAAPYPIDMEYTCMLLAAAALAAGCGGARGEMGRSACVQVQVQLSRQRLTRHGAQAGRAMMAPHGMAWHGMTMVWCSWAHTMGS